MNVFDIGGDRYPKINNSLDFFAVFHEPHFAVVEVAPLEPTRTEPGRAPAAAEIDPNRQHQYVYMVRDLGARRQPALVLTIGAGLIFLVPVLDPAPSRARADHQSQRIARPGDVMDDSRRMRANEGRRGHLDLQGSGR